MESITCSNCGTQNRAGVKFCTRCGSALAASPAPADAVAPPAPVPSPAPAQTVVSHVEGQAVIIGDNARQQISYYGDIIVRVDSLEELPPKEGQPPYKGLTYYTEADEAIFFGREQLSDDLAARLMATPFLAVAGASGSGKSSLLRAGVVPRLRRRNWLAHVLTPTADPLAQLAATLTRDDDDLRAADALRAELAADPQTLRRKAGQLVARAGAARLLLVVDQFEELFTQCHDEAGRRAFIDNLLAAARNGSNVTVLIGLRADFTGRLTEVEELRALVEQNFALLGPMQQAYLVRVILEPARLGGWAFVSGLVEQFLSDVGQEPGRLPLLSHALLETWARRSSHVMTLKGYRAAGGVEGAIAKTAEDTLHRLDEQTEQPVMQAVFLALTELGEGSEDTRRIARRDELARAGDAAAVAAVLETLAAARLVTVDADSVQVAHEALIRRWPRLREWLADNRERLRFERQLEADAREWERLKYDKGELYRSARLAQAQEWRKEGHRLSSLVEEFLDKSVAEVERETAEREREAQERIRQQEALSQEQKSAGRFKRLSRWLTAAAVVAVTATVIASVFAILTNQARIDTFEAQATAEFNADKERNARATAEVAQAEVERLSGENRSRRLAFEATSALTNDNDRQLALLLAIAAYQSTSTPTDEALSALQHIIGPPVLSTRQVHESITSADISPDGSKVVFVTEEGTVGVWDVDAMEVIRTLDQEYTLSAEYSPNGDQIVTSGMSVKLWSSDLSTENRTLESDGENVWIDFSLDGTQLIGVSASNRVQIWDIGSGERLRNFSDFDSQMEAASLSTDNSIFVTKDEGGKAAIWDASDGNLISTLKEVGISSAIFSPSGDLITTFRNGDVKIGRVQNGLNEQTEYSVPCWPSSACKSDRIQPIPSPPPGLSTVSVNTSLELTHSTEVTSVEYNVYGNQLITTDVDGAVHMWDLTTGKLNSLLEGHMGPVYSVAINPVNGQIITVGIDGTVKIWSDIYKTAKELIDRPFTREECGIYYRFDVIDDCPDTLAKLFPEAD